MSSTTVLAYCLERISRQQLRKRNPSWTWESPQVEEKKLEFQKGKVPTERVTRMNTGGKGCTEKEASEMFRGYLWSAHLNTNQHINVRKPPEVEENPHNRTEENKPQSSQRTWESPYSNHLEWKSPNSQASGRVLLRRLFLCSMAKLCLS